MQCPRKKQGCPFDRETPAAAPATPPVLEKNKIRGRQRRERRAIYSRPLRAMGAHPRAVLENSGRKLSASRVRAANVAANDVIESAGN
eukprot:7694019-Pyramimonas_sp.AAC.1